MLAMIAPVLIPLVWPVGVMLLWLSPRWRRGDKLIGTLVLPGGLYGAWFIGTGVRTACQSATGAPIAAGEPSCPAPLAYQITHPTPWWEFNHVFGPIMLMLLIALPIAVAIYLEIRLGIGSGSGRPHVAD
jgi:hypothetical protein